MIRTALPVAAALLGGAAPASAVPYDFDGDRRQSALLGVPGWSQGGAPNAGSVIVLRPTRGALSTRPQLLMEGDDGLPGVAQGDDALGLSTASDDFDGDGFADLAVAAPGDRATLVIPGSRAGLRTDDARTITGTGTLVAGDLDGDGKAELVIGKPAARSGRRDYPGGAIRWYAGTSRGLRNKRFHVLERPRRRDIYFGLALAIGDVNGDGRLDLIEGSQGETDNYDLDGVPGHVSFCPGTRSGPKRCRAVGAPLPGGPTTIAVADVDGDGFDDVLGGRPVNEYVVEDAPPGAVQVWPGTAAGPSAVEGPLSQRGPGIPGRPERGDEFGAAVAAADIDRDGFADAVIGAPGEDGDRGTVVVVRGGPEGVSGAPAYRIEQPRGRRRTGDRFGAALTLLRLTGGGGGKLVVGAPGERSITVFGGRAARLRPTQRIVPSRLGLRVPPEPPDALAGFGGRLARPAGS